jgi:thymidylate synthase
MPLTCDEEYHFLLRKIIERGDELETRNHRVKSIIDYPQIVFTETPLVTVRRPAIKKAIGEMGWFLSGDQKCPEQFLDWWDGQLDKKGKYIAGYGDQLRNFSYCDDWLDQGWFDQIEFLLKGLKEHRGSRRLVATTWNPGEMAIITDLNENPNTPSCCHGSMIQCFVRDGKLHITQYQRSADVLLGVPHNWLQYFSLLLYLAYWSELEVGSLRWIFGDVHLYQEESHIECARQIIEAPRRIFDDPPRLVYTPTVEWTGIIPEFKASDFTMEGVISEPLVTIRPKLL